MSDQDEKFYVTISKNDERIIHYKISEERPTEEAIEKLKGSREKKSKISDDTAKSSETPADISTFGDVLDDFKSMMNTYSNMVPTMIALSPQVAGFVANKEFGDFAESKGEKIEALSSPDVTVFEMHESDYGAMMRKHEAAKAAIQGASHLSEIAVIGLISVYDAYLGKLLRLIFKLDENLVFHSEKDIKLNDLVRFSSIDDAKAHIVDKEVEGVLRNSHHEQFNWMERRFDIPLTKDLSVWPKFIELCERRNLLTHTGGFVSAQYLKNCKDHGLEVKETVGTKLRTGPAYFGSAVSIVSEIGIKLGHVLWRKLHPSDREEADQHLNTIGVSYIQEGKFDLAKCILDLGVNTFKKHASERNKRMMIINFANAHRLSGDIETARKIIGRHDWSATGYEFQICVAAVCEDIPELVKKMKAMGTSGEIRKPEYRDWPVFDNLRSKQEFKDCFGEIFGEPLFNDKRKVDISVKEPPESEHSREVSETVVADEDKSTVH